MKKAQSGMKQPADQNAAIERGEPIDAFSGHQRDHDRDKGKAGALNDGKFRANRADPDRLKQRRDAGKEHRHLDHVEQFGEVRRIGPKTKPRCARHDNRGRHIGDEHREDMLDPKCCRLKKGRHILRVAQLRGCSNSVVGHGPSVILVRRWRRRASACSERHLA